MLSKILVLLIVVLAVLFVLPKTLQAVERLMGSRTPPSPPARPEDLVRCPSCGGFHRADTRCVCGGQAPGEN